MGIGKKKKGKDGEEGGGFASNPLGEGGRRGRDAAGS